MMFLFCLKMAKYTAWVQLPLSGNMQYSFIGANMAWHSTKSDVHHASKRCTTGNNIEKENHKGGTGGKPLCKECARLLKR